MVTAAIKNPLHKVCSMILLIQLISLAVTEMLCTTHNFVAFTKRKQKINLVKLEAPFK
jgi:hypothetical protein